MFIKGNTTKSVVFKCESSLFKQDQSINLSVCLDQQNPEKQQEQTATGGRCFILVRQLKPGGKPVHSMGCFFLHECVFLSLHLIQCGKPELQSMEGTLERKHKLQLGGKKVRRVWARAVSKHEAPSQHSYLCFHRPPPEAGAPSTLSSTDTPCASSRTERTRCE